MSVVPGRRPSGYYQVWGDEFNGTSLDPAKWDYWLLGSRCDAVNVTNAVSVGGGNLMSPVLWLFVTNAIADSSGLFQLLDLQATNFSQRFYRVSSSQ